VQLVDPVSKGCDSMPWLGRVYEVVGDAEVPEHPVCLARLYPIEAVWALEEVVGEYQVRHPGGEEKFPSSDVVDDEQLTVAASAAAKRTGHHHPVVGAGDGESVVGEGLAVVLFLSRRLHRPRHLAGQPLRIYPQFDHGSVVASDDLLRVLVRHPEVGTEAPSLPPGPRVNVLWVSLPVFLRVHRGYVTEVVVRPSVA